MAAHTVLRLQYLCDFCHVIMPLNVILHYAMPCHVRRLYVTAMPCLCFAQHQKEHINADTLLETTYSRTPFKDLSTHIITSSKGGFSILGTYLLAFTIAVSHAQTPF